MFPHAPELPLDDDAARAVEHFRSGLSAAEQVDVLAAALQRYGRHHGVCNVVQEEHGRPQRCTCGFALVRELARCSKALGVTPAALYRAPEVAAPGG